MVFVICTVSTQVGKVFVGLIPPSHLTIEPLFHLYTKLSLSLSNKAALYP